MAGRSGSVADATDRLRQRRTSRRRRSMMLVAWVVALTALLSGVAYLFFGSPAFVARQVRVEGVTLLSADQVRQTAAIPRLPLARLDVDAINARVEAMPQVGSSRVRVRYPSTVVIEVIERTPAVQRLDGANFQWVDAQGVVFHQQSSKLPTVVVVRTPTTDARLLSDAATIAQALTPTLRQRVQRIEATTPDAFTLLLSQGQTVVWGSAADSVTKAQVATAMLGVKATVYDVSSPTTPTSR